MKLFLIHVGFYDPEIIKGLYEQHSNYFVVAEDIKEAKKKAAAEAEEVLANDAKAEEE